ncbi:TetR/AcrR family transcriptional regulator [Mycolicibacterium iranicum]|uniref:TetR family transcriptional regulator n=1 Tax=Mycolicibacterium iranicum TaxID=912594 RepID=A0A178M194_MYCIR|nr:TetR/AcrR family transcriptional regulator [Mycolicibacterium iranicum]OAN40320.1 TetR family transcriptional regulator [Mycolicibacterium iranicum]
MSTADVALPEQQSTKAARLLASAGELLLTRGARGFTVADVAKRARVGKGTVYLYWPTKEDLLIGLVGRGFLGLLDDLIERITDDPELARPSRFCPMMLEVATGHPLLAALQRHDDDLLGVLAVHPRSIALHDALGPSAVIGTVLPIWRRHALARDDWELADQGFALHALITGVAMSVVGPGAGPRPSSDPLEVLADAVAALLGPERAGGRQIASAAREVIDFLRDGRATALRLIG